MSNCLFCKQEHEAKKVSRNSVGLKNLRKKAATLRILIVMIEDHKDDDERERGALHVGCGGDSVRLYFLYHCMIACTLPFGHSSVVSRTARS